MLIGIFIMLLRSTLEKVVPVREGESRLSKEARGLLFRGFSIGYLNPLHALYSDSKVVASEKVKQPFIFEARQTFVDGPEEGMYWRLVGKDMIVPRYSRIETELKNSGVLARADRIHTIARCVTLGAATALAATGIYLGAKDGVFSAVFSSPQAEASYQDIGDCSQGITANQMLVPIDGSQINNAQAAGLTVCQIDGYDYEFDPNS